jgi:hypothetical protein
MSDIVIFALVLGGMFVIRLIAATVLFYYILPKGDRCPNCDAATARVQSKLMGRLIRNLRKRWCMRCGWEGYFRKGELTPEPQRTELSKTSG